MERTTRYRASRPRNPVPPAPDFRSRMMLGAAAALAVLGALTLAPSAGAQGKQFFGVVIPGSDSIASFGGHLGEQDYAFMAWGNVGTLRFKASWRVIEPSPGVYRWAGLDRIIGNAAARGIRSLPVVNLPPSHVRIPPTRPADRQAFRRLMFQLARRYGWRGSFWQGPYQAMFPGVRRTMPVRTWQIFNEQNARHHWQGHPWPRRYGQLARAGARGVKRHNPRAEIVLGGMYGTPGGRDAMTSWEFLRRVYNVNGIRGAIDTVAVHPYARTLRGLRRQMRRIRRVMRNRNHRVARIRVTELSWGAERRGHFLNVGPQAQRHRLRRAFQLLVRQRGRRNWNVGGATWYSWHDGGANCGFCDSSGLFRGPLGDRTPRPAWRAFRNVASWRP
jgi:hypothetical protein